MADERRRFSRARISGARVRFEGASGRGTTARALDLAEGGVFVQTERPLPVGKRLSLEIHVGGELAPWPALGRVVWLREAGGDLPPGMGVAFIALDEAVIGAIDRVLRPLLARQAAEGGTGAPRSAPARERTQLGVGPSTQSASPPAPVIPPAPVVMAAPAREETLLGVGAARAQELTLPGDLDDAKAWEVDEPPTVQADRPVEPRKVEARKREKAWPAPAAEQSVAIDWWRGDHRAHLERPRPIAKTPWRQPACRGGGACGGHWFSFSWLRLLPATHFAPDFDP